jgi:hypothetical protein
MSDKLSANSGKHARRLSDADLTAEQQRAAIEARRAERETERYQEDLARDIEAYQQEFPPAADHELVEALAALRRERERQGLSGD